MKTYTINKFSYITLKTRNISPMKRIPISEGLRMSKKTKEELAAEVRKLQNSKEMKRHRAKRKWQRENQ